MSVLGVLLGLVVYSALVALLALASWGIDEHLERGERDR